MKWQIVTSKGANLCMSVMYRRRSCHHGNEMPCKEAYNALRNCQPLARCFSWRMINLVSSRGFVLSILLIRMQLLLCSTMRRNQLQPCSRKRKRMLSPSLSQRQRVHQALCFWGVAGSSWASPAQGQKQWKKPSWNALASIFQPL